MKGGDVELKPGQTLGYTFLGGRSHILEAFLGGGAKCNVVPMYPWAWLGTGSQDEYDRAASLPLCKRCAAKNHITHREGIEMKRLAPLVLLALALTACGPEHSGTRDDPIPDRQEGNICTAPGQYGYDGDVLVRCQNNRWTHIGD